MENQLRLVAVFAFIFSVGCSYVQGQTTTDSIIEIRAYNLKPGTRDQFHKLMADQCVPLLKKWEIEVVAFGPSIHDENSYFLMRAFRNLDDHKKKEDAFYASVEWEKGPQDAIMSLIKSYTTIVLPADDAMMKGLKQHWKVK